MTLIGVMPQVAAMPILTQQLGKQNFRMRNDSWKAVEEEPAVTDNVLGNINITFECKVKILVDS